MQACERPHPVTVEPATEPCSASAEGIRSSRLDLLAVGTRNASAYYEADVQAFDNFIMPVPEAIGAGSCSTVIVWCETFGQFITSASIGEPGARRGGSVNRR
jgi:hypothetical protein